MGTPPASLRGGVSERANRRQASKQPERGRGKAVAGNAQPTTRNRVQGVKWRGLRRAGTEGGRGVCWWEGAMGVLVWSSALGRGPREGGRLCRRRRRPRREGGAHVDAGR